MDITEWTGGLKKMTEINCISNFPPRDVQHMTFARFLRLVMDYGLGKRLAKGHNFTSWTEEELTAALEDEFGKRFPDPKGKVEKRNTLSGWLHQGKLPQGNNLTTLVAVLIGSDKSEEAMEWRKLLIEKARYKPNLEENPMPVPVGVYPRGRSIDDIPKTLGHFFKNSFSGLDNIHLQSHLSPDHALDVFERSVWTNLPDKASSEEILHILVSRAFFSAVFEQSLSRTLKDTEHPPTFDDLEPKTISHVLNTCSEPFRSEHLLIPESHPSFAVLCDLHPSVELDQLAALFHTAFFREFFRNSGFYMRGLKQLWSDCDDGPELSNDLQLKLHKASIEYEVRKSLFATRQVGTGEPLSLRDIYVELPCVSLTAWEENSHAYDDTMEFKDTGSLVKEFCKDGWNSSEVNDHVLILRGDPGAGKSSVLKTLAWQSQTFKGCENAAILFVPFQKGVQFSDTSILMLFSKSLAGFSYSTEPVDIIKVSTKGRPSTTS